jgi:hypothetical protein
MPHTPARLLAVTLLVAGVLAAPPGVAAADAVIGDATVSLGGWLDAWGVVRLHPDTPDEDPSTTLALRLDAEYAERFRLIAGIDAGFDGKIGAPRGGNPVLPTDRVYADRDVFLDIDEFYLEIFFESFELRLGKQKVSWGQLDEIQPTDHLNPEDLTEFLFRPELDRKIGVPGLRLLGFRGPWTLDLVWNPFYTAMRFPNEHDRWFPPLLEVPEVTETSLGALPTATRYRDVRRPARTLANSDAGIRFTRFWRGAEMSLSAFHGFDKTATFGANATADVRPSGDPTRPVDIRADVDVFPSLHRITMVGGDLAVPLWLVALRAEAAWITGRYFPTLLRDELTSGAHALDVVQEAAGRVATTGIAERVAVPLGPAELRRDLLHYGIGVDVFVSELISERLIGSTALARSFVLLQLEEEVILDHDSQLIADPIEHILGFTLRRSFWDERLRTEVKVAYLPSHGDYYVWPQLTYAVTPHWHLLLGARAIGGASTRPIGQYRDYDGVRLGMRLFVPAG